jgi:hypothetical protein
LERVVKSKVSTIERLNNFKLKLFNLLILDVFRVVKNRFDHSFEHNLDKIEVMFEYVIKPTFDVSESVKNR